MTDIAARLAALRAAMRDHQLAAWLAPTADPHLSEYLPEHWKVREWLSGFTGSMGTLVVTPDFAGLWADSRYWSQAEAQLAGTGIALMKIPSGAGLQHIEWLAAHVPAGQQVGVDAMVLGLAHARALEAGLVPRGIGLRTDRDRAFDDDEPCAPTSTWPGSSGPIVRRCRWRR